MHCFAFSPSRRHTQNAPKISNLIENLKIIFFLMLEKKFQIKNKYSGGSTKFETPVDFLQKYTNFFFYLKELFLYIYQQ